MQDDIEDIWIDLNEELYKFILKKVNQEDIAKDLLQDVFVKIKTKIHQLKHSSKITSWVYQITRNVIYDYYRQKKIKQVTLDNFDIPESENDDFSYSNLSNCITEKIKTLSTQHKEAIILTSFKNISQKELSNRLQLSYSGAKSRVQKAKEILKDNILNCPNVVSDTSNNIIDFEKE